MNRKLHNTAAALLATTGMLVLALIAASPMPLQSFATPAPSFAQTTTTKAARVEAAADRIEARAKLLESRLTKTTEAADAVAQVAAFAAEAATVAILAEAFDGESTTATSVPTPVKHTQPIRRSRQSVAMPYFSFAPRG